MRYIIHLLPEREQRRAYDMARSRLAATIGYNRALDYPTAHVTLIWAIQDDPGDPSPIEREALIVALERHRGNGVIPLAIDTSADTREHLLLPLIDSPALAALRRGLYDDIVQIAIEPTGGRAAQVREQPWPHLTLAQEITPDQWERGMAQLRREDAKLLRAPLLGSELALLARDLERGERYRIVARVPLGPPNDPDDQDTRTIVPDRGDCERGVCYSPDAVSASRR